MQKNPIYTAKRGLLEDSSSELESGKKKENQTLSPLEAEFKKTGFYEHKMHLSGFNVIAGKTSRFVRISSSLPLEDINERIYNLMTEDWNFKAPQLIISMNGGAKRMIPLNNDQKLAFKRGLMNVSKSAPTWIVTGGFQEGITKLVGEAAKDYSMLSREHVFTVLGIGTWGAVFNRKDLMCENKAFYHNVQQTVITKGQSLLDPHHDAFILFDDTSECKFGKEIEFRAQFEEYVSKKAKCSAVQFIVEGGRNTILTGANALKSNIPVVVMKDSKRAADVICDVVESSFPMLGTIIAKHAEIYKDEWHIEDKQQFTDNLKTFYEYYNTNGQVHLFNMRHFKHLLATAIIEAAFSGTINGEKLTTHAKLNLAIAFDRVEEAEKIILDTKENIVFREYVKLALLRNQWKFVDLFLRQGLIVESFLSGGMLRDLYFSEEISDHSTLFLHSILRHRRINKIRLSIVGKLINKLTNCFLQQMYREPRSGINRNLIGPVNSKIANSQDIDDTALQLEDYTKITDLDLIEEEHTKGLCCFPCGSCDSSHYHKMNNYTIYPPMNKNKRKIYTEQDLFIWALLTQKFEMAKIFWKNGKDHIGSALVASVICSALEKKAEKRGEIDIMNQLVKYKIEFENIAVGILSEAYKRDQTRTHLLLIRALPYWARESCLGIANKQHIINFLFHSACQTRLNAIWCGKILLNIKLWRIICNLPFGFLTSRLFLFPSNCSTNADDSPNIEPIKNPETLTKKSKKSIKKDGDDLKREEFLTKFRDEQQISSNRIGFGLAIKYFYTAPVIKFMMSVVSYITFLTVFSYVMIVELNTVALSPNPANRQMEYAVYAYILSLILGEISEFFMGCQKLNFKSKVKNWKYSMWNWFDMLTFVVFGVAFILRMISDDYFIYCQTLYAISLSMFYIKFMEFYYIQKHVGPKVIMISEMMKDILFFLAIYLIALLAYGTLSLSLLYPNLTLNNTLVKNIIYNPYWQLFGQIDLNYMEGSSCFNGLCGRNNTIVIVANAIFLLFANVLLLSLLIAMFGVTFTKVEENSNKIWAFTRYRLIEEYYYKPVLPPPLNIFEVLYHIFIIIPGFLKRHYDLPIDDFIVNLSHEEDLECSGFEQQCMETYLISKPMMLELNTQDVKLPSQEIDFQSKSNPNQALLSNMMSSITALSEELKLVSEKVYKIRRSQKITHGIKQE